jgi:U3 small nucleolar RNA-associated protein 14
MDSKSLYAPDSSSPRENDFFLLEVNSPTAAAGSIPISDMFDVIDVAHSSLLSLRFVKKIISNLCALY